MNAAIFYSCLTLAGLAYAAFIRTGSSHLSASLTATAVLLASLVVAGIVFDVEAFVEGAVATISQLLLKLNTAWKRGRDFAAILAGILIAHVSLPHIRGTPYDWPTIGAGLARCLAVVSVGYAIGATFLSQEPGLD